MLYQKYFIKKNSKNVSHLYPPTPKTKDISPELDFLGDWELEGEVGFQCILFHPAQQSV